MSNRIVYEIRHGLLVLRVRRIRAERTRGYSVSIRRFYRNGELWSQSSRFGAEDLPSLRYLIDEAHTWIISRAAEEGSTGLEPGPAAPKRSDAARRRRGEDDGF